MDSDPNNWYQSPNLGMIPAAITNFSQPNPFSPLQFKPSAMLPPFSQPNYPSVQYRSPLQTMTKFSQPYHYPPPQPNHPATIINGHLFFHHFPHVSVNTAPSLQSPPSLAPLHFNTTPQSHSIPSFQSPFPNPNFWIHPLISRSDSDEPSIAQLQVPTFSPIHDSRPRKSLLNFRCGVAMASKSRVIKKTRKSDLHCGVSQSSKSKMKHKTDKSVVGATTTKISSVYPAIMDEIRLQVTKKLTEDSTVCDSELKHESADDGGMIVIEHSHKFPDDDKEAMFIKLADRGWLVNDKYVEKLPSDIKQGQLTRAFGKTLPLGSLIAFETYGRCNSVVDIIIIDNMKHEDSNEKSESVSIIHRWQQYWAQFFGAGTAGTKFKIGTTTQFDAAIHQSYSEDAFIMHDFVQNNGYITCMRMEIELLNDSKKETPNCLRDYCIMSLSSGNVGDYTFSRSAKYYDSGYFCSENSFVVVTRPLTYVDPGWNGLVMWAHISVLDIEVVDIPGDYSSHLSASAAVVGLLLKGGGLLGPFLMLVCIM